MGVNKLILFTLIMSLTGCALENNSQSIVSSSSSSISETVSSSLSSSSSSLIESSTISSSSSLESSSSFISSSTSVSLKELKITPSNFNKLSFIELEGVVENTSYPDEFTFNTKGVMKSNKIEGIKEIIIDVYNTYENLKVYPTYDETSNALVASSQKDITNKRAVYTYTLNGVNEFYIINSSSSNRTHVYSVTIKYSGETLNEGSNTSSSSTSSSSSSSKVSSSSSSSNSSYNTDLSTNYTGTYYNNVNLTLKDTTLRNELRTLTTNTHKTKLSYDDLKTAIPKADASLTNPSKVLLIYSRREVQGKYSSNPLIWNREHVWPQSKGWFTKSGAGSDLHHIRPEDPDVNSNRGNTPFGETSGYTPVDEAKGDVARIIFYLLTRYSESDSYSITNVASSMEMLLRWNELDPVDAWEMQRNNVGEELQGNRNPFIDYPSLAVSIWA